MSQRAGQLSAIFAPVSATRDGPLLEIDRLSVHFGGVAALTDVRLMVQPHEFMAIVGANGAGKSTLLNSISGLVPCDRGSTLELEGRSIRDLAKHRRTRVGVGRSFQDPALLEDQTVLENLLAGAHDSLNFGAVAEVLRPLSTRRREAEVAVRAQAILDLLDIRQHERELAGSIAYGVQKLVDIGRAMMARPKLLLLDEPTSGLVARERRSLIEALLRVRDTRSVAVVFVEHHFDVVDAIADLVATIEAGSVLTVNDRRGPQITESVEGEKKP